MRFHVLKCGRNVYVVAWSKSQGLHCVVKSRVVASIHRLRVVDFLSIVVGLWVITVWSTRIRGLGVIAVGLVCVVVGWVVIAVGCVLITVAGTPIRRFRLTAVESECVVVGWSLIAVGCVLITVVA